MDLNERSYLLATLLPSSETLFFHVGLKSIECIRLVASIARSRNGEWTLLLKKKRWFVAEILQEQVNTRLHTDSRANSGHLQHLWNAVGTWGTRNHHKLVWCQAELLGFLWLTVKVCQVFWTSSSSMIMKQSPYQLDINVSFKTMKYYPITKCERFVELASIEAVNTKMWMERSKIER